MSEAKGHLSNFDDIRAFHERFGLTYDGPPRLLDGEMLEFRMKFLEEELHETKLAAEDGDLPGFADGLVDLVYVALGTAYLAGIPWQDIWDRVQAANMAKVRAQHEGESTRQSKLDVVKPLGWLPPNVAEALVKAGWKCDGSHEGEGCSPECWQQ